jgi:hypothetical protein
MSLVWHSLLAALVVVLQTVAPLMPHPYDRLIAIAIQLCLFLAELSK